MKLYLFGGAELDIPSRSVSLLKDLIKETLIKLRPTSILHIPFARLHPTEEEWHEGWFKEVMSDTGIQILDARKESEFDKSDGSVIFINGGIERRELMSAFENNNKLLDLLRNTKYIVAESAGSMVMGEFMRADRDGNEIIKGTGILQNTIIEPHYTEKNREQLLLDDIKKSGMKYGIGIDSATAIVIDLNSYPKSWEKIGYGNVEFKTGQETT